LTVARARRVGALAKGCDRHGSPPEIGGIDRQVEISSTESSAALELE
jgi:hypothetical protein